MCSELTSYLRVAGATALLALLCVSVPRGAGPRFYPDDPLAADNDGAFDASGAKELDLSETYDFVENSFSSPGNHDAIRAVNVNTLDEVPDSSWFTNRIGRRPMPVSEILRGPDKFERLETD